LKYIDYTLQIVIAITKEMNNYIKGIQYEHQIKHYLISQGNKRVYLWEEIPMNVFIESKIFENYSKKLEFLRKGLDTERHRVSDTGCDIYYFDESKQQWVIVQCKNYEKTITMGKLAGFYAMCLSSKLYGELYYTSSLSEPVTRYAIEQVDFKHVHSSETSISKSVEYTKLVPYDYQLDAIEAVSAAITKRSRAILQLPCGMGKTLVMIKIAQSYNFIFVFSPLKAHARQNLDRFRQELSSVASNKENPFDEFILVDSDGTRDIEVLCDYVTQNKRVVFSATYKSRDVMYLLLDFITKNTSESACVLIDEFHNLTSDDIFGPSPETSKEEENSDDDSYKYSGKEEDTEEETVANDSPVILEYIEENDSSFYKIFTNGVTTKTTTFINDIDNDVDKPGKSIKLCETIERHKFIFVSATPRVYSQSDDEYISHEAITGRVAYEYSFGEAIKNKYICDYDVFVPDITLSDDDQVALVYEYLSNNIIEKSNSAITAINKSNARSDAQAHFLLRCLIENGHSKCIAYSKSVADAQDLMASIELLSKYHFIEVKTYLLVAETSKRERSRILEEFSSTNKKAIICSVRILDECIDIPRCDSVFLSSRQSNKIRTIQRICRANRKDQDNPNKKSGIYIFLDEYDEMTELIANLKEFDESFTKEKIKICNVRDNTKSCVKSRTVENEIEYKLVDKYIVGVKNVSTWYENLKDVDIHIKKWGKLPPRSSKNKEDARLGRWLSDQKRNAKTRKYIMHNDVIYNTWITFTEEYKGLFLSNSEIWMNTFEDVKKHKEKYGKLPSKKSKNKEEAKLGMWLSDQKKKAKTRVKIMQDDIIYNTWVTFTRENKDLFLSNSDNWMNTLEDVKKHKEKYGKLPSTSLKNKEEAKLGNWLCRQKSNAKTRVEMMKDDIIYNTWITFTQENNDLFLSNSEIWMINLENVKKHKEKYGKLPSIKSKNKEEVKLGRWLSDQKTKAKTRKEIMHNDIIYNTWITFTQNNKNLFLLYSEIWMITFEDVKTHKEKYGKLPSKQSKDKEKAKLGKWLSRQKSDAKTRVKMMKDDIIYNTWITFTQDNEEFFLSNKEFWVNTLENVKKHKEKYGKLPSGSSKDKKIAKLGSWLSHQKKNAKTRNQIMQDDMIYNTWITFTQDNESQKEYIH